MQFGAGTFERPFSHTAAEIFHTSSRFSNRPAKMKSIKREEMEMGKGEGGENMFLPSRSRGHAHVMSAVGEVGRGDPRTDGKMTKVGLSSSKLADL